MRVLVLALREGMREGTAIYLVVVLVMTSHSPLRWLGSGGLQSCLRPFCPCTSVPFLTFSSQLFHVLENIIPPNARHLGSCWTMTRNVKEREKGKVQTGQNADIHSLPSYAKGQGEGVGINTSI